MLKTISKIMENLFT